MIKKIVTLLFISLGLLIVCCTTIPNKTSNEEVIDGIIITAAADVFVKGDGTQNGTGTELSIKGSGDKKYTKKVYLKFDLEKFTDTAVKGTLRLFPTATSGLLLTIYEVNDDSWSETEITFKNSPDFGSAIATGKADLLSWSEFDITDYINRSLASGDKTISIAIFEDSLSKGTDTFDSREIDDITGPQIIIKTSDSHEMTIPLPDRAIANAANPIQEIKKKETAKVTTRITPVVKAELSTNEIDKIKEKLQVQYSTWSSDTKGITRDGTKINLIGQSYSTISTLLNNPDTVFGILDEFNKYGGNAIRLYQWMKDPARRKSTIQNIETWNDRNPDNGDPNKSIHYWVQLNPMLSNGSLPDLSKKSDIEEAIYSISNKYSLQSQINDVLSENNEHLMGILIYHELNVGSEIKEWIRVNDPVAVDDYMNKIADEIHTKMAPGLLVSHTGDVKVKTDPLKDAYLKIESIDDISGNVFANFDFLGWDFYISNVYLISGLEYGERLANRRNMSVMDNRGWIVGETGPSNLMEGKGSGGLNDHTQSQAMAQMEIMYEKCLELGDLVGYVYYGLIDSKLTDITKMRGWFDFYGYPKSTLYTISSIHSDSDNSNRSFENQDTKITGKSYISDDSVVLEVEALNSSEEVMIMNINILSAQDTSKIVYEHISQLEQNIQVAPGESIKTTQELNRSEYDGDYFFTVRMVIGSEPENSYKYGRDKLTVGALSLWAPKY